jgi:hypothetical protein
MNSALVTPFAAYPTKRLMTDIRLNTRIIRAKNQPKKNMVGLKILRINRPRIYACAAP